MLKNDDTIELLSVYQVSVGQKFFLNMDKIPPVRMVLVFKRSGLDHMTAKRDPVVAKIFIWAVSI